jgi:hypothetical protein
VESKRNEEAARENVEGSKEGRSQAEGRRREETPQRLEVKGKAGGTRIENKAQGRKQSTES